MESSVSIPSYMYVFPTCFSRNAARNLQFLMLELQAPNGIGTVLAIIQLVLFSYYKNASRDNSVVPLLVSHDMINGKVKMTIFPFTI